MLNLALQGPSRAAAANILLTPYLLGPLIQSEDYLTLAHAFFTSLYGVVTTLASVLTCLDIAHLQGPAEILSSSQRCP